MSEPTDSDERLHSRPLVRLGADHYSRPFRAEVMKRGRIETRSVGFGPASAVVADRLGLPAGSDVVHRVKSWYFADGQPVRFGITYIPAEIARDTPLLTRRSLGEGGIYARFEELGWTVARIREEISARMPTREEAGALSMPPGVPVIEVLHTSVDAQRGPFEVTRQFLRADLYGLDYDTPIENR